MCVNVDVGGEVMAKIPANNIRDAGSPLPSRIFPQPATSAFPAR
jgi:hypothetical protein